MRQRAVGLSQLHQKFKGQQTTCNSVLRHIHASYKPICYAVGPPPCSCKKVVKKKWDRNKSAQERL